MDGKFRAIFMIISRLVCCWRRPTGEDFVQREMKYLWVDVVFLFLEARRVADGFVRWIVKSIIETENWRAVEKERKSGRVR